jgi:hypothetical protein
MQPELLQCSQFFADSWPRPRRTGMAIARPSLALGKVAFSWAVLHVRGVNGGTPCAPLSNMKLPASRRLQRESAASPFKFVSERVPFSTAGLPE